MKTIRAVPVGDEYALFCAEELLCDETLPCNDGWPYALTAVDEPVDLLVTAAQGAQSLTSAGMGGSIPGTYPGTPTFPGSTTFPGPGTDLTASPDTSPPLTATPVS